MVTKRHDELMTSFHHLSFMCWANYSCLPCVSLWQGQLVLHLQKFADYKCGFLDGAKDLSI